MNEMIVEYCPGSTVSPLQWPRPRATVSAFVIMMNFAKTSNSVQMEYVWARNGRIATGRSSYVGVCIISADAFDEQGGCAPP